jgi:hypothetical protein
MNEVKTILNEMIDTIEIYSNFRPFRKSVSFKNENQEFLINNRNYIIDNDLQCDLWYTLNEMNEFKQHAITEIQIFMMINPGINSRDAMRIMWNTIYSRD